MTACATTATCVSLGEKGADKLDGLSWLLLFCGWLASPVTGIFSFTTASYARRSSFIDVPYRDIYTLPMRVIQVTTSLYLFSSLGLVILLLAATGLFRRIEQILINIWLDELLWLAFLYGETVVMRLTLTLIIFIRQRAKQIFGPSYQVQSSILLSYWKCTD